MIELRGKLLIRRATNTEGKPVLVIAGVMDASVPIANFDAKDEMWATILYLGEHIRFVNEDGINFSPEDFLENANDIQDKECWTRKD